MDNGNFYYPFSLTFITGFNKDIYFQKVKELSDDYTYTDHADGDLSCIVCFNTSEKYYKFIRDTGVTGYKVLNSPEQIKQKFYEIAEMHIKKKQN